MQLTHLHLQLTQACNLACGFCGQKHTADGELTVHKVAADETLTRIAREYYGDKRLWPYIVKYNNMGDPNGLCRGMEIMIPRLIPRK